MIEFRKKIFMSQEEYDHLVTDFGKDNIESILDAMEDYLLAHGKKYKDYYRAVRMWIRKQKQTDPRKAPVSSELLKKRTDFARHAKYNWTQSADEIDVMAEYVHVKTKDVRIYFNDDKFEEKLRQLYRK